MTPQALGLDLGSRRVKIAALSGTRIAWLKTFDTIPFYRSFSRLDNNELVIDFQAAGIDCGSAEAPVAVAATGYGRNAIRLRGARILPEIQAHCRGVTFQTGFATFTLLDLGGQDTKVARVEKGLLTDFVMNDKCAASSGRYLENMAAVLDVSLEKLSSHWQDPVPLSATCGIFGESELIGRILEGHPLENLCAGVNQTLLKRILPMLRPFPLDLLVVTGGVAHNQALITLLRRKTGASIIIPEHPTHNGAIGCAAGLLEDGR
ncbi:MAG: 2-hydroxyglutaryl-CoA dehydratase [Deltaproteobacteria bacterium]|nr:2-hydroxyglutaryl-CoA dehydratase [Deltaproteobacteria bacterium]